MLPKPIPKLTKRQWDVLAEQLKKPASPAMKRRLGKARQIASQIRVEE